MPTLQPIFRTLWVAPVRERGLKYQLHNLGKERRNVAPVRERGLKFLRNDIDHGLHLVVPVRERGLKSGTWQQQSLRHCRSRKGAWIEIAWHCYE